VSISQSADALIALAERVEVDSKQIAQSVTVFTDDAFGEVLTIVGNMHDPLIVDTQVHMSHAEDMVEDWLNTMLSAKKKIKSRGWALKRLGG
jgi:hypothetical protein